MNAIEIVRRLMRMPRYYRIIKIGFRRDIITDDHKKALLDFLFKKIVIDGRYDTECVLMEAKFFLICLEVKKRSDDLNKEFAKNTNDIIETDIVMH